MRTAERWLVVEAAVVGYAVYMASLRAARRLSPRLSGEYRRMSPVLQLEWDGRLPSTLHAVGITAATAYLFLLSPVFSADHAGDVPFVLRTSPASDAALGFSLGYFATDLLMLAVHWPAFGGAEMALHHVAALLSVGASAFQGQAHAYTLALLATECTTPFVNLRFLLDKGGWRDHPLYTLNGMLLLLSWMVARILLFIKFFHHVAAHLHEFPLISSLSRGLIYGVPPVLFVLNCAWFAKIFKGAMKLVGLWPQPKRERARGATSGGKSSGGGRAAAEPAGPAAAAAAGGSRKER